MDELKQKYVGKYFGENRISDIEISDFTTVKESVVFNLSYESGKKELVTEKSLVLGVTDQKSDATTLLTSRIYAISADCVDLVREYDLPSYLFDRLGKKIEVELQNNLERASCIMWYGDPSSYAPGFKGDNLVTLLMADRLNKKFPPENAAG